MSSGSLKLERVSRDRVKPEVVGPAGAERAATGGRHRRAGRARLGGSGISWKELEFYPEEGEEELWEACKMESSGRRFVFLEWHRLPTRPCERSGWLQRPQRKRERREGGESSLLDLPSVTWPCLCAFQRRRSAEDELAMRGFLQEGDLISVSCLLRSASSCLLGSWGAGLPL